MNQNSPEFILTPDGKAKFSAAHRNGEQDTGDSFNPLSSNSDETFLAHLMSWNSLYDKDESRISSTDGLKVFFKGLRKRTTPQHLLQVLSLFGEVVDLKVPFSTSKQKNMGYGSAVFADPRSVFELKMKATLEVDQKLVRFYGYDFKQKKSFQDKLTARVSVSDSSDKFKYYSPTSKRTKLSDASERGSDLSSLIIAENRLNQQYSNQIVKSDQFILRKGLPSVSSQYFSSSKEHHKECRMIEMRFKPTNKGYHHGSIGENHLCSRNVRFRACQSIAHCVSSLNNIQLG